MTARRTARSLLGLLRATGSTATPPASDTAIGLGPSAVEVQPRRLRLGEGWCASLAITGYPRQVGLGWLEPLLTYPGRLDVALHVEPIPPQVAATRLRRRLARLEAGAQADQERGRLPDYAGQAAAEDAHELAARLARGEGRLFRLGLYLTVHARTEAELDDEVARVRALAAALLMDAKPATFRSLQGWISTLPLGIDALGLGRTFDTSALAAAFPFTSPDQHAPLGEHAVLYGVNSGSSSLVMWDRFTQDNHNSVILARSGAGKSYLAKLEILRSLYTGVQVCVIDPEDEYARLADAVGGTHLALGAEGVRLNPFDLPTGAARQSDALTRRALFLHTLTSVLLEEPLDPGTRAALDRGIVAAYHAAGLTMDPRTWSRRPPVLADLAQALEADGDPKASELAARLAPFVTGTWRGLFDGPTTTHPDGHLIVFSLRDLPEELKTVGTLLTLDAIWRRVTDPADRRPRLVVVDEGWLLMRQPEGARFLYRMAKSARKHWAGLTVITQDAADVLGSDLGQAVVANAATQILLRQAPQALDQITEAFALTEGERHLLASARRGQGLLAAGADRVAFDVVSSPAEHALATTDPAFLAELTNPAPGPKTFPGEDAGDPDAEEW
ncbi:VirB4 family type IV secretion system protein [Actinomadura sp. SCN-SB]|uniref:VirB4 family type IV secretion system protein n=1 Tax=Actinomadura sp. SCN-SB TaxID=3373092 RepID=UPI0037533513